MLERLIDKVHDIIFTEVHHPTLDSCYSSFKAVLIHLLDGFFKWGSSPFASLQPPATGTTTKSRCSSVVTHGPLSSNTRLISLRTPKLSR
ncbi:hypothetical protein BH24DEI2_BH24DEI2_15850 [soil metagenome]